MPALLITIGSVLMRVMFWKFIFKVLMGLGFGIFSYKYVGDFFDKMNAEILSGYNSLPTAVLALLDIGGFTTGINIMLSGTSMLVGVWMAKTTLGIMK